MAAGIAVMLAMPLNGALVIYEPFADSETTLNANTPGTGLTGTWLAEGGLDVVSGSMTWGSLATSTCVAGVTDDRAARLSPICNK